MVDTKKIKKKSGNIKNEEKGDLIVNDVSGHIWFRSKNREGFQFFIFCIYFLIIYKKVLPCWFGVLLLLFNSPFKLSKSAKAIACSLLACLACESKWNLLWCLLWTSKNWLNTTLETLLLTIITTATEGAVTFFTTWCLCNLAVCVFLAELAEELLGLWMVNHWSQKGSATTVITAKTTLKIRNTLSFLIMKVY